MKMTKNKFFSLSLMLEGIKQTKTVGICFTVITIIASCLIPISRIFEPIDYTETVSFSQFALPVFIPWYIIPMILIGTLFSFMNKRNASDFYHSVPLNRTCIYITYSIVTFLWSVFMITISMFLSFALYNSAQNVIITPNFLSNTLGSSLILAVLVMAISLVAKGLSGTGFSNIVITILIMFAPRIIMILFADSITWAVPIAQVEAIPFVNIFNNIIFAPFGNQNWNSFESVTASPYTMWYSLILAVIYWIVALFLHKIRRSEAAETSSSFKGVQHIVRTMFGIIPALVISVPLAGRMSLDYTAAIVAAAASLLFYFLYELATTKSAKKLLTAIPLYLIVVAFNIIFVLGSHGVSDAILNDIPEISDIDFVTVLGDNQVLINYGDDTQCYTYYKLNECKLKDSELIETLRNSLIDDVDKIKAGEFMRRDQASYEKYDVTFNCKAGRKISRTVYVDINKLPGSNEAENNKSSVLEMMKRDNNYVNAMIALPADKEIEHLLVDGDWIGQYDLTADEQKEIWGIFKSEYAALSYDDKISLNSTISTNSYYDENYDMYYSINVYGYIGTRNFYSNYSLTPDKTPKTLTKIIEKFKQYADKENSKRAEQILSKIDYSNDFMICSSNVKDSTENYDIAYSTDDNVMLINKNSEVYYKSKADKIDINEVKKIAKILIDAAQEKCDVTKDNLFYAQFYIYDEYEDIYQDNGDYWVEPKTERYFVNLTDKQYKEINDIIEGYFNDK